MSILGVKNILTHLSREVCTPLSSLMWRAHNAYNFTVCSFYHWPAIISWFVLRIFSTLRYILGAISLNFRGCETEGALKGEQMSLPKWLTFNVFLLSKFLYTLKNKYYYCKNCICFTLPPSPEKNPGCAFVQNHSYESVKLPIVSAKCGFEHSTSLWWRARIMK